MSKSEKQTANRDYVIYAYVTTNEDGPPQVCAAKNGEGLTPLIGHRKNEMVKWEPYVKKLRERTGEKIVLMKYVCCEVEIDEDATQNDD